jgi:hypothetical protein
MMVASLYNRVARPVPADAAEPSTTQPDLPGVAIVLPSERRSSPQIGRSVRALADPPCPYSGHPRHRRAIFEWEGCRL